VANALTREVTVAENVCHDGRFAGQPRDYELAAVTRFLAYQRFMAPLLRVYYSSKQVLDSHW
jgi:hypothetical protein